MNDEMKRQSRVMAVFRRAALAFDVPAGTTLGELAERVDTIGAFCGGTPLYVDVRLPAGG